MAVFTHARPAGSSVGSQPDGFSSSDVIALAGIAISLLIKDA